MCLLYFLYSVPQLKKEAQLDVFISVEKMNKCRLYLSKTSAITSKFIWIHSQIYSRLQI
jgi:hypothetical protein